MKTRNIYSLPFKKEKKLIAISHPKAHFDHFKHAIDFILPEGMPILAARGGRVVDVKVDSNKGGFNLKYNNLKYLNYITLKHDRGEYSQYCHIKHNGALVKVGQKVKPGQKIALSGNTGFTSQPHLHFMIFKLDKTKIGWRSLEPRFKEKIFVDKLNRKIPVKYNKIMKEIKK
jgi:murein DD-endopeptidase MepM/ murein hydrolase activator NlpD